MDTEAVSTYLTGLQARIVSGLEAIDGGSFRADRWSRPEGGGGLTRIIEEGGVFERAGVGFSRVQGPKLPPSASGSRPELAGRSFDAMGVSLVLHPRNPYCPTVHMNVRCFVALKPGEDPVWWFGGGMDLTPYYGFEEDARHFHATCKTALTPFGEPLHPRFKKWCDEYFYLPHRSEPRGVGGIFFDHMMTQPEESFAFLRDASQAFIPAYLPIARRRDNTPFEPHHRQWQLLRRGRYVEFNLVWDRGTHFGLQSGGRTESILLSMPPMVSWSYRQEAAPGTPERKLTDYFLVPRDWLAQRA